MVHFTKGNIMRSLTNTSRKTKGKQRRRSMARSEHGRTFRFESLEQRQVLASDGFLQGFAFVDGNNIGNLVNQLDSGDSRKVRRDDRAVP